MRNNLGTHASMKQIQESEGKHVESQKVRACERMEHVIQQFHYS